MKRISEEKIKEIICHYRGELKKEDLAKPLFTLERDVAQAQLLADQQEHERIVREIFKGIESRLPFGIGTTTYSWWVEFKNKYLGVNK